MGVPPGWEIPEEIKARLSDQSGRQRTMVAEGHIVMVLHRVPHARDARREVVFFWRKPSGEWKYSERGQGLTALRKLVDDYNAAAVQLEGQYKRAADADDWFTILEEVGPIFRASRNLYETLQAARESIPDPLQRIELQRPCDVASDVVRATELLQTETRDALDFHIAKQNEIQSKLSRDLTRAGHRLNAMASVFLPLAAIASVFGMNLKHGLEGSPTWVFWSVLAVSILLGVTVSGALLNGQGNKQEVH